MGRANAEFGIKIYDVPGIEVKTPVNGHKQTRSHTIQWDGRDEDGQPVSSGVYIYRIEAVDPLANAKSIFSHSRTMVLLK